MIIYIIYSISISAVDKIMLFVDNSLTKQDLTVITGQFIYHMGIIFHWIIHLRGKVFSEKNIYGENLLILKYNLIKKPILAYIYSHLIQLKKIEFMLYQ